MIVTLNDQYNPSWIYCDRGSGEYQIERLHIIGDERPSTGLKNKVKGWQFKNVLDIMDPITKEVKKEPLKPFMVNQLQISFERDRMILSPFDEVLHKQLMDYEVVRVGNSGPVFTSKNEHFVDALGLAHLAFVLEFPDLTGTIKTPDNSSKFVHSSKNFGDGRAKMALREAEMPTSANTKSIFNDDPRELKGDKPSWIKVDSGYRNKSGSSWGSRSRGGNYTRSGW